MKDDRGFAAGRSWSLIIERWRSSSQGWSLLRSSSNLSSVILGADIRSSRNRRFICRDFRRLASRLTAYTPPHRTPLGTPLAQKAESGDDPVVGKLAITVSDLDKFQNLLLCNQSFILFLEW